MSGATSLGAIDIIAFVPTADSSRSRAFYEGVLGLRFVKDDGFALVFDANGIMIRIAKAPEFKPAQFTILGWQVTDIENIVAELEKKGVHFERFGSSSRTSLAFGPRLLATKWLGSKIRTATFSRCRNTCDGIVQCKTLPVGRS